MSQIIAIDDYSRERSGKAKNILSRSKSSRSFPLSQKCVFFVPEETLEYYNNDDVSSVSCRLLNKKSFYAHKCQMLTERISCNCKLLYIQNNPKNVQEGKQSPFFLQSLRKKQAINHCQPILGKSLDHLLGLQMVGRHTSYRLDFLSSNFISPTDF